MIEEIMKGGYLIWISVQKITAAQKGYEGLSGNKKFQTWEVMPHTGRNLP